MDGILVVNKPAGITSHDVVNIIRRKFNIKRVGHAGTLDPMATGVLILLLGMGTKLSSTFLNDDKEYIATIFIGRSTDTQDSTGKTLKEKAVNDLDIGRIKAAFNTFTGDIEQTPPMVSAKKYKGRRLYQLARKGKTVPREPRNITIHEIEILNIKLPEIIFRVKCSKGTYIRALCEDIGRFLGYPSHMSSLVRTSSGKFTLQDAHNLRTLDEKNIQPI